MHKPFAIFSMGHTYEHIRARYGDFHDWIAARLGDDVATLVVDVVGGEPLPQLDELAGVVISGSPHMVSDRAPWSEATARWLCHAVERDLPVLGICYGHQLLAHAFDGHVAHHPAGLELGSHSIHLTREASSDPLFADHPPAFDAHLVHRQSVRTLPPNAQVLAWNAHEAHQAFRIGRCAWGVQFHPEFDADIMRAYIDTMRPGAAEADAPRASEARDTPLAASLLRRFAQLVLRPPQP
jgi:GMP synthase (glutamine-hydrolysing)